MLSIIKLILYYFGYQLGFMGLVLFATSMDITTATSIAMVASTIVMAWHLIHFRYVRLDHDMYRGIKLPVLGVSVVFIFSAMYVLNLLIEQAGIPNTMEDTFLAMSRNPLGALSIAVLAPILEELLFRGAIQSHLQAMCKHPWTAIIVASLIFGIVHGNPAQIPFAFLLGTLFGWLYFRTGSLLPGIIGHVLNNSIATVNMILYGNATIEEQMQSPITMWLWAVVATIACIIAAIWLDKHLKRSEPV